MFTKHRAVDAMIRHRYKQTYRCTCKRASACAENGDVIHSRQRVSLGAQLVDLAGLLLLVEKMSCVYKYFTCGVCDGQAVETLSVACLLRVVRRLHDLENADPSAPLVSSATVPSPVATCD